MISEQYLLAQAKEQDVRALEDIYDLYSPRLYRYAVRLLGDACSAEDCVAETFSRFLQALRHGGGLMIICRRTCFAQCTTWSLTTSVASRLN